uniref:SurA N-terminal domain-containing protein n=1 Tax=Succinivibrio sp. TaxID=2053619 RepID=UPI003FEE22E8
MKLHNNLGQKLGKLASLSTVLLALFGNAYAEEQVLDSTAAVVNNGIILESELNTHTQKLLSKYAATGAKVDEITARRQALQSLITRELILQIAQTNGAEVTDMQLDSTLESAALRNKSTTD